MFSNAKGRKITLPELKHEILLYLNVFFGEHRKAQIILKHIVEGLRESRYIEATDDEVLAALFLTDVQKVLLTSDAESQIVFEWKECSGHICFWREDFPDEAAGSSEETESDMI